MTTEHDNPQNPDELHDEIVRSLSELPDDVLAVLHDLPSEFVEHLAELTPEARDNLTRLPVEMLNGLGELPTSVLEWLGRLCGRSESPDASAMGRFISLVKDQPAPLAQLKQVPTDVILALSELPQEVVDCLFDLPPEMLRQFSQALSASSDSVNENDAGATVADVSPELMATLSDLPAEAAASLANLPMQSLNSLASIEPDLLATVADLPEELVRTMTSMSVGALTTIMDVPIEVSETISEIDADLFTKLSEAPPEQPQIPGTLFFRLSELTAPGEGMLGRMVDEARSRRELDMPTEPPEVDEADYEVETLPEIPSEQAEQLAAGMNEDMIEGDTDPGEEDAFATMAEFDDADLDDSQDGAPPTGDAPQTMLSDEWFEGLSKPDSPTSKAAGDGDSFSEPTVDSWDEDEGLQTVQDAVDDAGNDDDDSFSQTVESGDDWSTEGLSVFDEQESSAPAPKVDADDDDSFGATVQSDDFNAGAAPSLSDDDDDGSHAGTVQSDEGWSTDGLSAFDGVSGDSSVGEQQGKAFKTDDWSSAEPSDEDEEEEGGDQTVQLDDAASLGGMTAQFNDDGSFGDSDDFGAGTEDFSDEDGFDQTVQIDDGSVAGGMTAQFTDEDDESFDQTVQSDDDFGGMTAQFGADDDDSFSQTVQTDSAMMSDDDASFDQTVQSDSHTGDSFNQTMATSGMAPDQQKTMADAWGSDFADSSQQTGMTIKSRDKVTSRKGTDTLVISERPMNTRKIKDYNKGRHPQQPAEPEYELLKKLGEGGMGVVYTARQTSINRDVALKMLKAKTAKDKEQQSKFLSEAVVTGDLAHPNIVPIYDVGRSTDQMLFYAMKKVEGITWQDALKEEFESLAFQSLDQIGASHRDLRKFKNGDKELADCEYYEHGREWVLPYLFPKCSDRQIKRLVDANQNLVQTLDELGIEAPNEAQLDLARRQMRSDYRDRQLDILMRCSDAIAFAHSRGVIHRDLKPENIMLGAFNEVLVMDWGLAFTDKDYSKSNSITESTSMGGTPAYMAPEMATGPITKIGPGSDIYLLGAMLFEIISGRPPHAGKNAMKCLMSAARNQIRDVDQDEVDRNDPTGELMQIALKSMETNPSDRFPAVEDMQAAIREHNSHTESVTLTVAAAEDLSDAKTEQDYDLFSRARFGFEQAISMWAVNRNALNGLQETRFEYAKCAKAKGDFDLGMGLLDTSIEEHKTLYHELQAEKDKIEARERELELQKKATEEAREQSERRRKLMIKGGAVALCAVSVMAVAAVYQMFEAQRQEGIAVEQRGIAETKTQEALDNLDEATRQRKIADGERVKAETESAIAFIEQLLAIENGEEAMRQEQLARFNLIEAERQRKIAITESSIAFIEQLLAIENGEEALRQEQVALANLEEANAQRMRAENQTKIAEAQTEIAEAQTELAQTESSIAFIEQLLAIENGEEALRQEEIALVNLAEAKVQRTRAEAQTELAQTESSIAFIEQLLAIENGEEAIRQEGIALVNLDEANVQRTRAEAQTEIAQTESSISFIEQLLALENQQEADVQRDIADVQRVKAVENEKIAVANEQEAQRQKKIAIANAYIAQIGLADAKIRENEFDSAREILEGLKVTSADLLDWEWGRLMHLCTQSIGTFDNGAPVDSIVLSPDGSRFVTAGWDGNAVVWDYESGNRLLDLKHDGQRIYSVAWSSDGRWIATGSDDVARGYVQLWNAETGERVERSFGSGNGADQSHTDAVLSVEFSRDGSKLLTSSYDGTARLWDVTNGEQIRPLIGHSNWVWDASFSPDGQWIVTASQDGTAIVWDTVTGEPNAPFTGHDGAVFTAAFAPDSLSIATGGYDRRVMMWKRTDVLPFRFDLLNTENGRVEAPQTFRAFDGHNGPIRSVRFSGDGQRIISGSMDNTVGLWDAEGGQLLMQFRGHDGAVRDVAFNREGDVILSASADNRIKKWDINEYEEIRVLQSQLLSGHTNSVLSAEFSPNGEQIVTASRDSTARIWSSQSGDEIEQLSEGHAFLVSTAVLFPNGRRMATGAADNTVRIWDVIEGTQRHVLKGTGRAAVMAVSPDGKWLITGSDRKNAKGQDDESSVKIWNAETGELTHSLFGHVNEVTAIAVSEDGTRLLSGDSRGRVKLWDLQSRETLFDLRGHTVGRRITSAVFLPGTNRGLTSSADQSVAQWNLDEGIEFTKLLLRHPDAVTSLVVRPGTHQVLTACTDGKARLWNADAGGEPIAAFDAKSALDDVSIDASGNLALAVDGQNQLIHMWKFHPDTAAISREPEMTVDGRLSTAVFAPTPRGPGLLVLGGSDVKLLSLATQETLETFTPNGGVASANFSPDGSRVVTGSRDSVARIWDTKNGADLKKFSGENGHSGSVNSAVFSPDADGQFVLTASDDGTVKLWNAATAEVIRTFAGHTGAVNTAVFSPDGTLALSASSDGTARLWNLATGEELVSYTGHQEPVLTARFSDDGTLVVSAGADDRARVWNRESGEQKQVLSGHTARVNSAAFSPGENPSRVVTASNDGTVKLWDLDTQKEILTLDGHTREVTSVAFSPDGRSVLTSSQDGRAILWLTADWEFPEAQPDQVAATRDGE